MEHNTPIFINHHSLKAIPVPGRFLFRLVPVVLWLGSMLYLFYAAYLFLAKLDTDYLWSYVITLASVYMFITGIGIYRQRRWGVVLFALFACTGALKHLFLQIQDVFSQDWLVVLSGLLGMVGTLMIAVGLLYITAYLWRRSV